MKLNVLYQSDQNYAEYMGVSVYSLLLNNANNEVTIYIIDDGIEDGEKNTLRDMVEKRNQSVVFVSCNSILSDSTITEAFSYTGFRKNKHSYLKLFFDRLIYDDIDRLIYLDCDTVVEADLSELSMYEMGENPIGMALDSLVMDSRSSIGLSEEDPYFNSGVVLLDVPRWKKEDCSNRILSHVINVRKYGTVDQDILNVEFKSEITILPVRYNYQPIHIDCPFSKYSRIFKHKSVYYQEKEMEEASMNPAIVHFLRFLGESPWNEGNMHPATKYYDKYYLESPWSGKRKRYKKTELIFRIEKVMYKSLPKGLFYKVFLYIHEYMIINSNS